MSGISSLRFDDPALNELIASIQNSVGGNDTDITALNNSLGALVLQVGSLSPDNVVENAELTAQSVFDLVKTMDGPGSGLKADIANTVSVMNPTINEAGAVLHDSWLNSISGELFICVDAAENLQKWIGQLGTIISTWNPDSDAALEQHFTMDNISGSTLINEVGGEGDAVAVGTVMTAGVDGDGVSFAANPQGSAIAGAYVNLPSQAEVTHDFTVSFNVEIDSSVKNRGVFFGGYGSATAQDFFAYYADSQKIRVHHDVDSYDSATLVLSEGWQHLTLVREGALLAMYVDGAFKQSWGYSAGSIRIEKLGTFTSTESSVHSRWAFDNWRFFGRALSADEIQVLAMVDS